MESGRDNILQIIFSALELHPGKLSTDPRNNRLKVFTVSKERVEDQHLTDLHSQPPPETTITMNLAAISMVVLANASSVSARAAFPDD